MYIYISCIQTARIYKNSSFYLTGYEFHNPVTSAPVFVLAELPPRNAINLVPANVRTPPVVVSSAAFPVISTTALAPVSSDYSVVSSVNFIPACIETKP